MGVVVTDGKVAAILKGSMKDVEKATRALATLEKKN